MQAAEFKYQLSDEISLSDEASAQLISIIENEEGVCGVRLFVAGGGCGGMSYGMTLVDEPQELDCTYNKSGLNIYIDAISLTFLEGIEIDFQSNGDQANFVFKNVFAKTGGSGSCQSCGGH
jgi:iron-sulfur cluster assembly accessory protein